MSQRPRGKIQIFAVLLGVYLGLTLISTLLETPRLNSTRAANAIQLPLFNAKGRVPGERSASVAIAQWPAGSEQPGTIPVLWLHGSPGSKENFSEIASRVAAEGRDCYAMDLPGFGKSSTGLPDVGSRAHARYVLALMDTLEIPRAHLVGWSNGGAVALNMADLAPDRVASVTMIASVGVQETEGSGSYLFEHAKYLAGLAAFRGLQSLTPDFHFFGTARDLGWLWNFQQTDQRRLRPIMESMRTPTLILHGRHDFLTPSWGAERHHDLISTSRLVMLDASHFIPFTHTADALDLLIAHFARHDTPGVAPRTEYEDRAPKPIRTGAADWIESLGTRLHDTPWWVLVVVIGIVARWRPMLGVVVCGMFVGRVDLDIAVAWLGIFAGMMLSKRTVFDRAPLPIGWLTAAVWAFLSIGIVFILEQSTFPFRVGPDHLTMRFGVLGLLAWLTFGTLALHVLGHLPRRRGRQKLRAQFSRATGFEWWPSWAVYLGVAPVWIGRIVRAKSIVSFTAANPGIERGGGFIGESKSAILAGLPRDPRPLAFELIEHDGSPSDRAEHALNALDARTELGGLPVILKPDNGERGRAVKLARSEEKVRAYFQRVTEAVQVQRYHPGPCEFGVFWVRLAKTGGPRQGEITGITRKVFFTLTGDGKQTIGQRILAHPRFRCQAEVFAQRHAARWNEVLEKNETLRLGQAGNHAQGCKFENGSELITPDLIEAIDGLASGFSGLEGGGLDYGRFDVRAVSDAALQRGEFAVIEINGVTSEPTHMYDPALPFWKAWGTLAEHWRDLYRVADARIEAGGKPLRTREALAMWWTARKRDAIRAD